MRLRPLDTPQGDCKSHFLGKGSLRSRQGDDAVEVSREMGGFGVGDLDRFAGALSAVEGDVVGEHGPLAAGEVVGPFEAMLPAGVANSFVNGAL